MVCYNNLYIIMPRLTIELGSSPPTIIDMLVAMIPCYVLCVSFSRLL